jgi:hypothetical protein
MITVDIRRGHDAADSIGANRLVLSPSSKTFTAGSLVSAPFDRLRAGSSQTARRAEHPQLWLCRQDQGPGHPPTAKSCVILSAGVFQKERRIFPTSDFVHARPPFDALATAHLLRAGCPPAGEDAGVRMTPYMTAESSPTALGASQIRNFYSLSDGSQSSILLPSGSLTQAKFP